MTLVIARKYANGQVSLSSDSRINFGTSGSIDYGIKIFRIPVKIFSPTRVETQTQTLNYEHDIGFAITGSAVNAYTIKEALFEMLQHLQYAPGYTDFSMEGLAKVVLKIFAKTSLDMGTIMSEKGLCELILTGYCPDKRTIRTFKFWTDFSNYPIIPSYIEILIEEGIEFFGSGKSEAQTIYSNNINLSPLHIVRTVIHEKKIQSVGGGLQTGEFENFNFKIFGIEDYSIDEKGYFKEYLHTLRGINLYREEFESDMEEFHISYTFLRPFEADINALMQHY